MDNEELRAEAVPEIELIHANQVADQEATEEVIETQAQAQVAAPEAMEAQEESLSDMERLIQSFSNVREGNLYSREVNQAIEIISNVSTMQEALQQIEAHSALDFENLLYRQVDQESRDLDNFMYQLQRIPSLPSFDVDFI